MGAVALCCFWHCFTTPFRRCLGPAVKEKRYTITFLPEHEIIGEFQKQVRINNNATPNPISSSSSSSSSTGFDKNSSDIENQNEVEYDVSIKSIHSSTMDYAKSNGMKVGDMIESIRVDGDSDSFEHEVTNLDDSTYTLLNDERPITLTCSRKEYNWLLLQYWWWDMLCCRLLFICPCWCASFSCVNGDDVSAIGELLKTNNILTSLDLGQNNITDVQSIGEALKTNNTLMTLWLDDNNITDVQSIGEGLKTNNTLEVLYLGNNNITDDSGIQSIIDVLKTNNTLKTLYLGANQLSSNMKSQLKAIQQYKRDGSNGYQQVKGMYIQIY